MSQRNSGYARKERDLYETPEWVTEMLVPHIPERVECIWEPAAGSGKMARALGGAIVVHQTDVHAMPNLHDVIDFLSDDACIGDRADAIITNPPYEHAEQFIDVALSYMERRIGFVSMLLRTDYDHAKTRARLFELHPAFAKKIVLTKRIRWFDGGSSPSFNHAWFIWDWAHRGAPTIAYAPSQQRPVQTELNDYLQGELTS